MKLKERILSATDKAFGKYDWYNAAKNDRVYRALFFSAWGALFTFIFAVFNGVFGVLYYSLWYGAFAGYLLVLALQRVSVIIAYAAARKRCADEALRRTELKIHLANGIVFLPITTALTVVILLIINSQKPQNTDEILAIAAAAYAFYKIITAIYDFTREWRLKDPVVQTVRSVSLVDALVSIVLLESTLITAFGELNREMYILITVSGLAVCLFAFALAVFIIASSAKKLRQENKEN